MPERSVIAAGHSHLAALAAAGGQAAAGGGLPCKLVCYQFHRPERAHIVKIGDAWRYNPLIERDLSALIEQARPVAMALTLQGEEAIAAGLTMPAQPYDFVFPGEEDFRPAQGRQVVPFDMMYKMRRDSLAHVTLFLKSMCAVLPPATFAICPPPPTGDDGYILRAISSIPEFRESIDTFGLPDAQWRQRAWRLHATALRDVYAAEGVGFVEPPAQAVCGGFLRDEFRNDVFHGNAAYGRLVLDQVMRLADEHRT